MDNTIPGIVYVLWWVGIVVTLVIFVPLAVYLLHRTWRAAHLIRRNSEDTLVAAGGIANATVQIAALDATISVAGDMLRTSDKVAKKLDTIASVLAERAG